MHRELTAGILLLVLAAGVLHASWNAITKAIEDRVTVIAWIGLTAAVLGAIGIALTGLPAKAAIGFALASAGIHVAYNFALIRAYRLGAFNQTYPIARGTAPLLVALGAGVIAGEHLSPAALAGVVLLGAGLMSLALTSGRPDRSEAPAVGAALLTGVAIAGYSLVDGLGVRHTSDPYSYTALLFLLQGPVFALVAAAVRPPRAWVAGGLPWRGAAAGVLSVVAYGIVLWSQQRAPLAEVSALRETGVISGAVMGALVFKEGFGARRVVSAVIVAGGIVLIAL
ncbi:MAG TPA: DMT family transporter [Acidimicrobiales bacterium]|nr:DMT family transporter [Acidimicrobiales bacterium]